MKTTKQNKQEVAKQPKVIKVKTLIVTIAWTLSIIAALVAGWTLKQVDNDRVHSEARVMLSQLVDTQKQTQSK